MDRREGEDDITATVRARAGELRRKACKDLVQLRLGHVGSDVGGVEFGRTEAVHVVVEPGRAVRVVDAVVVAVRGSTGSAADGEHLEELAFGVGGRPGSAEGDAGVADLEGATGGDEVGLHGGKSVVPSIDGRILGLPERLDGGESGEGVEAGEERRRVIRRRVEGEGVVVRAKSFATLLGTLEALATETGHLVTLSGGDNLERDLPPDCARGYKVTDGEGEGGKETVENDGRRGKKDSADSLEEVERDGRTEVRERSRLVDQVPDLPEVVRAVAREEKGVVKPCERREEAEDSLVFLIPEFEELGNDTVED